MFDCSIYIRYVYSVRISPGDLSDHTCMIFTSYNCCFEYTCHRHCIIGGSWKKQQDTICSEMGIKEGDKGVGVFISFIL